MFKRLPFENEFTIILTTINNLYSYKYLSESLLVTQWIHHEKLKFHLWKWETFGETLWIKKKKKKVFFRNEEMLVVLQWSSYEFLFLMSHVQHEKDDPNKSRYEGKKRWQTETPNQPQNCSKFSSLTKLSNSSYISFTLYTATKTLHFIFEVSVAHYFGLFLIHVSLNLKLFWVFSKKNNSSVIKLLICKGFALNSQRFLHACNDNYQ